MNKINKAVAALYVLIILGLISCGNAGPQPIKLGQDACSFCKMSIANKHFGAEIITKKGKVFKFDDTHCVLGFMKAGTINNQDIKEVYLVNFEEPHNFISAQEAFLLRSSELHAPMGGNVASFADEHQLNEARKNIKGETSIVTWNELEKANQ